MASGLIGIGATRVDLRIEAAIGRHIINPVQFEACQSVDYGGVLFLLPFLIANGLLSYQKYYSQRQSGYYDFDTIMLTVAFMYLCRIKSIEQLKHQSPGEIGKLLGLDRVAEARCLRSILKEISDQEKSAQWNAFLAEEWINNEEPAIFYVDGHVQVYHGYLATLGKKHVSRQRLCLPGMMEFWVNNADGLPYFFVTGQVNEKLQQILEEEIIPNLNSIVASSINSEKSNNDKQLPRYTLVFDREGYSPQFFGEIWNKYQVAVITYRKNVKETWDETEFVDYEIETELGTTNMLLAEKEISRDGVTMREIRKQSTGGHQTSIITTNQKLSITLVALYMFARWSQENFFRYMRQEYDLDRIMQYGIDELDSKIMVVNREYSNLTHYLKKTREKIARKKALLYSLKEENTRTELEQTSQSIYKQLKLKDEIELLKKDENDILKKRSQQPYKIAIADMPYSEKYNKLKTESKHLQNIIKMICYRAETAFANIISVDYKKKTNEIRALVKSIIFTKADILPNYTGNTLTITLYSLATQRDINAIKNICMLLNETETIYPGTNLKLIYKTATI